jgi:putative radical SAM enzyme (TIGR03279 family)
MLKIVAVQGKLAKKLNLKKGDAILAFDEYEAVDILDYLFYDSKRQFTITVQKASGEKKVISVQKEEEESLNLTFEQNEEIRTCHNHCIFCFVDQMAEGMRKSLYVKDDDYTMSFMCGNFVTLTNLSESEMERIIRLHLSPLYVSVHAMEEDVRCKLLGNRFAGKIVEQLKRLTEAKITVHCQAVVVPDVNDGQHLEYTARALFAMYPYVADLAVVPTGITKFREGLTHIDNITPQSAADVLDLCDKLNKEFGVNFLLPADEYFVRSGREMKGTEFYGDFSQIENGIGMTTKFVDDFHLSMHEAALKKPKRVAVVTGVSACATIEKLCQEANGLVTNLHSFALPVVNEFFGESVTCTGLLTGGDILSELQKNILSFDSVIIPSNTLKQFEDVFLDDMTVKDLKGALKGKKVIVNRNAESFFDSLLK